MSQASLNKSGIRTDRMKIQACSEGVSSETGSRSEQNAPKLADCRHRPCSSQFQQRSIRPVSMRVSRSSCLVQRRAYERARDGGGAEEESGTKSEFLALRREQYVSDVGKRGS